jgi:hypothetical protein
VDPFRSEPLRAGSLTRAAREPSGRLRQHLAALFLSVGVALLGAGCGSAPVGQSSPTPSSSAGTLAAGGPTSPPATAMPTATISTAAPSAPTPTPVPTGKITVDGANQTFESLRYGYSLTASVADWLIRETAGDWNGVFEPRRLNPDPGTDWIRDPGVATIEIGEVTVPAGTTLAVWEASEAPAVRMLACTEATSPQPVTVAGQSALLLAETCPKVVEGEFAGNQFFLNAFLVHGTSGLVLQWNSQQGHEAADKATFLKILATLKWTSG